MIFVEHLIRAENIPVNCDFFVCDLLVKWVPGFLSYGNCLAF